MNRPRSHDKQDDEQILTRSPDPCGSDGSGARGRACLALGRGCVDFIEGFGCTPQALHEWVKKAEIDSGKRSGVPSDVSDRLKALERENRELRQANEILRKASAYFAQAELDCRYKPMIVFIDDHREVHGVEPICKVLPIAPSTYHAHVAKTHCRSSSSNLLCCLQICSWIDRSGAITPRS